MVTLSFGVLTKTGVLPYKIGDFGYLKNFLAILQESLNMEFYLPFYVCTRLLFYAQEGELP